MINQVKYAEISDNKLRNQEDEGDGLSEMARAREWEVFLPPKNFCTDNAAMIAAAGYAAYKSGERSDISLAPDPAWSIWKRAVE